jgi:putative tricarboxylic transport membrane protein
MYIGNVMLLVLNLPLVGLWVKMLKTPEPLLYAGILVFATIGTYGISQSPVDLVLLYLMGGMGLFMRLFDFPTAPVIIGMILGPLAEQEFRRALQISQGDLLIFVQKPLSLALLLTAAVAVLGPVVWRVVRGGRRA